jgi:hypothetical protein
MSVPRLANQPRARLWFLAQTPALVVATLALALSAGGAAYATDQLSTGPRVTTTVTFHKLTLINGWKSVATALPTYKTGDPSVGIANGVVYLTGSLFQSNPGSDTFATLPVAYRPAHTLFLAVYTLSGAAGGLFIYHSGIIGATAPGACNGGNTAQCWTSLSGVSYPKSS